MYIPRLYPKHAGFDVLSLCRISPDRVIMLMLLAILSGDSLYQRIHSKQAHTKGSLKQPLASTGSLLIRANGPMSVPESGSDLYMQVDRLEFAKQIAISILVNHDHEITDQRVSFKWDPKKKGTAINQFADAYGEIISRGVHPSGLGQTLTPEYSTQP